MTNHTEQPNDVVQFSNALGIGGAVALALRKHRISSEMSIRELARAANVSSAMISRIENSQVSPSLSTLESLASALSVPVISFFQHTIQHADVQFVKSGKGLDSKRYSPDHVHTYEVLTNLSDSALRLSAARVSLRREDNGTHPVYYARGYVFNTVVSGTCIYSCGGNEYRMEEGDSIGFDAQIKHGVVEVISERFTFITVAVSPN